MIHFDDPVTQAQYERLRTEPCTPTGTALTRQGHSLYTVEKRVSLFRRGRRPHWRCTECSLDEMRVKGVCMTACAGMCSWPKCLGEG